MLHYDVPERNHEVKFLTAIEVKATLHHFLYCNPKDRKVFV